MTQVQPVAISEPASSHLSTGTMSTGKPAKHRKSQLGPVFLDVLGKTLTESDVQRIAHPATGGVILFARNFESRAQLRELVKGIRKVRKHVLIAVDHEGGRVQRFKSDGFTHLPAMSKLGALWDADASESKLHAMEAASACGYVLGAELRAYDIDLSFTPVLDLDYGQSSVIGDRAFHHDPRVVSMLARALNQGLAMSGMANCGKHFPGHGFVAADSHIAVPVDERPFASIIEHDARPYEWLSFSLASVMPAHVIYPKVDKQPAGFSRKWLQDILRKKLGFEGVIFSDDLSMEGASVAGSVVDGAQAALTAGCDMVLICNSPDKADELLAANLQLNPGSAERIARLQPGGERLKWKALQADRRYQQARKLVKVLK